MFTACEKLLRNEPGLRFHMWNLGPIVSVCAYYDPSRHEDFAYSTNFSVLIGGNIFDLRSR